MRRALPVLALLLVVTLPACGSSGGKIVKADTPATTSERVTDDGASDDSGTDDSGTTDDTVSDDGSGTDGGAGGGISGGGSSSDGGTTTGADFAKCREITTTFTDIATNPPTDVASAQATIDQMAEQFPEELRDDFRTLIDVYSSTDPAAANSEEFRQANEAIDAYLGEICGR